MNTKRYFKSLDTEVDRIWKTINNLVENTHEEIDKVKDEIKSSKKKKLPYESKGLKHEGDVLEKSLSEAINGLRDDVHNQLVEVSEKTIILLICL